ncbi:MAG: family 78 glycoside hydrolase catalytic domain [Verrucomicrobia bacterium]|nr:family 78 glycoside hydrolase catalytic domain [Verrucomicrobiota bacterium]
MKSIPHAVFGSIQTAALAMRLGLVALVLGVSAMASAAASLRPVDLRCESLVDPLGLDALQPRLSWVLEAGSTKARGLSQTAYQVLVASHPKFLAPGRADLWDTGRVSSDQSIHLRYGGKALSSHGECFWKVRVWDQDGQASSWSKPAKWTMGLLAPTDWKAQWIGKDEEDKRPKFTGADWIWFPEGEPAKAAPIGTRYFRRAFELPADRVIKSGTLLLSGDNEFACTVNGQRAGAGNNFKSLTVMNVTSSLKPGRNWIAAWVKNAGPSPNPAGLVGMLRVEFETGAPLTVPTDGAWKSFDKDLPRWTQPDFDDSAWTAARVLGPVGMAPWNEVSQPEDRRLPARYLRKEFTIGKKVRRATAYVCGLGLSELFINGRKAGDHVLSPALSEYPKRSFYVTHDVTALVQRGPNALGVALGNGRYFAPRRQEPTFTQTYGFPKLLLQLRLEFTDGTASEIVSDDTWKLTTAGPIRANNEYDGEEYDARQELTGWAAAGFDDSQWQKPQLVSAASPKLSAQMQEPIRVTEAIRPVAMNEVRPGVFIYDLGQNLVGWCRLRVRGPRGTAVQMRFAETLKPDGTLYLDNIRGAKVTDIYTLKGRGTEVWEPAFAYHGFRYVELTGFPGRPTLTTLEGRVVNDDLESGGEFTCSQPTINQVYRCVRWGVRGNYRSLPTDCPQRDERQGWLGDRSGESRGETYLFRNGRLYAKWVQDMADAQRDNGSVSDVCPAYWPLFNDSATWPSSLVVIPGALLDQLGDTETIARTYPAMVKWIEHLSGFITNGILPRDTYGDWCVPPEDPKLIHSKDPARKTAGPILGTTYFHHCLKLMARYATLLDKPDDARRFAALAEKLKAGLNEKYLNEELGRYDNGAQTTSVLPLAFDMVPADQRLRVFDQLVNKITGETKGHIGTGLVGGQWLNRVLTDNGRPDLSYTFATNRTYPSWGYMVEKGATTVWELWNGDTADPAMNSGNHVMLVGDLVIWLNECVAGLRPDPAKPGFKHIMMRPTPVGDLQFVKATHRSSYGLIASEWRRDAGAFRWNVTVPPNTSATLFVPAKSMEAVTEGGQPISLERGVKFLRMEGDRAVLAVQSGNYVFAVR